MHKIDLRYLVLLSVIFLPKITLININDYDQGIRFDDIFCILVGFYLLAFRKPVVLWPIEYLILIIYLLFIMLISVQLGISQQWIVLLRGVEYFFLAQVILGLFNSNIGILRKTLVFYILLNSIIGILQHYGYLGGFTSYMYMPAGHGWLERAYGVTGGPWEFGLTIIMALHILMRIDKNISPFRLILLNSLVIYDLILADTRSNLFAYIVSIVIFYREYIYRKFIFIIIFVLILFYFFHDISLSERLNNVFKLISYILKDEGDLIYLLNIDLSLSQRLNIWEENYELWRKNIFSILFGIGWHSLYMESFILRMIFSFGILGSLLLVYLYRKLDKSILILVLISGLTLDLFLSIKIFAFFLVYSEVQKVLSKDLTLR